MADATNGVINAKSARQSVLYFPTSAVHVDFGSDLDLANQSFTIEFWDRQFDWNAVHLLVQGSDLCLGYNAQKHLFFKMQNSTLTAPKAYDEDRSWHHWAVTFDADTNERIIYLNGFPTIDDIASQPYTGTGEWSIAPDKTTNRNAGFQMADLRIWDYVRSHEEIQADRFRRLNGDEAGLVGYWPLDEGHGFTAYDRTSRGNHGKISYATCWRQQLALQSTEPITKLQAALRLNGGSSSRASIYPIPGFSTGTFAHTLEAWFCPTGFSSNYSCLMCVGYPAASGNYPQSHYWALNKQAKTLEIGPRTSDRERLEIPIREGKWYHIASVSDGKQLSVYVDGEFFPRPIPVALNLPYLSLLLGQNWTSYNSNNEDGRGMLAEVRLWKGARSQEEIQADLYHRLVGNEPNLAIYWPANEGYKGTLHDKTTYGKHATISGSYVWEEQLFLIPAHHDSLQEAQEKAIASHRQRLTGGSGTTSKTTASKTTSGTNAGGTSGTTSKTTAGKTTSGTNAGDTSGTTGTTKTKAKIAPLCVLSFDGIDDYIDCGTEVQPTEAIAVEAWVKHLDGSGYIVNRGGSEAEDGYSLSWQDGKIRVELQNTQAKKKVICENPTPSDNEWHHIAFTWNRKKAIVCTYIDGQPAETTQKFAGMLGIPSQQALNIGRNALHDGYFHGQISEVRIWKRVRSQEEIEQGMKQRLDGSETGLVGYWPMDDKGAIVKDRSGGDRNATIRGATWETAEVPLIAAQLWATGLQDYGYWYRWKQSLPEPKNVQTFRRGRI